MIVDDHDGFRGFARSMLEAAGFTVAEAATGAEATEAARTIRPGLVLLDIGLPDFDGFEVARRLAAVGGGPGSRRGADLDPRGARLRRADRGQPGRRVPAQRSAVGRGAAPVPGPGPVMNRWLRAALIAGAIAAVGCFVWTSWPPNSQYAPVEISFAVVGLSFMVAGIAAWQRWPASRLGLLFTIVGYLYLVPYILVNLANPVAWTIGNVTEGIYGAALAHLGLAWPSGRLRSRFECGVIVADYVQNIAFNTAATMFWNPAFSGCNASCPANVLLIGDGSRSAWNTLSTIEGLVGLVITGIVLTLIVRHWRSARGWSRRAMIPLLWIGAAVGAEEILTGSLFHFSAPVTYALLPLVLLAGPALFVISTVRARTAGGALGTAIVDLEPGASPGRLRDALARALGDSTLQLAFRQPGGAGHLDTSGQAVDADRPDNGRAVVPTAKNALQTRTVPGYTLS